MFIPTILRHAVSPIGEAPKINFNWNRVLRHPKINCSRSIFYVVDI